MGLWKGWSGKDEAVGWPESYKAHTKKLEAAKPKGKEKVKVAARKAVQQPGLSSADRRKQAAARKAQKKAIKGGASRKAARQANPTERQQIGQASSGWSLFKSGKTNKH